MVKYNLRAFSSTILGLAFGTYIILFLLNQNLSSIKYDTAFKDISTTISINLIIWTLFAKWFWKIKIFYPWLVPFPDLAGNWEGTIISTWQDKIQSPISISIQITQTFFNTQIKIQSNESNSFSVAASFDIDKERGLQQLYYSYINTPKTSIRERSQIHYGTALLQFSGFNVTSMEGEYWTSRKTIGEIKLNKIKVA